jgi:uncharacterized protein with PQ loop repeat
MDTLNFFRIEHPIIAACLFIASIFVVLVFLNLLAEILKHRDAGTLNPKWARALNGIGSTFWVLFAVAVILLVSWGVIGLIHWAWRHS